MNLSTVGRSSREFVCLPVRMILSAVFLAALLSAIDASGAVDLAVAMRHDGNFTQHDSLRMYVITVKNLGTDPSSGAVTVSASVPTGLTAIEVAGSG